MQVYFDASLRQPPESVKGEPCQEVQIINVEFVAGGLKRVIPAVYCFAKGVVFDILTVMGEQDVREYFDKYKRLELSQETLTDVQMEQIWQENPYQDIDGRYWINNHPAKHLSATGDGYLKDRLLLRDDKSIQTLRKAYPQYLEKAECFFYQRICIEDGFDYTKEKVSEIKLVTNKQFHTDVLDMEIEVQPKEEGSAVFIHPLTGVSHQIFIYDTEVSTSTVWDQDITYCVGKAEVVPELPEEERLLFDNNLSYAKSIKLDDKSARSIAVIGGEHGPTAMFFAGKMQKPVNSRYAGKPFPCFSKPQWSGEDARFVFHITGLKRIVKEEENIQVL